MQFAFKFWKERCNLYYIMNMKKIIYLSKSLIWILILSFILSSCAVLFPTQRMLDDVLPYRDYHFYCKSDLIPFSKAELKNAKTVYGLELSEYFYANKDRSDFTDAERDEFLKILSYRNHNYALVRERYEMYNDDMATDLEDYNQADQEFNAYYKLSDSPLASEIREQNNNQLMGNPNISFSVKIADLKNVDNTYFEADADIYIPVYIDESHYKKIKIDDTITLDFPKVNQSKEDNSTVKKKLTYVATDSFIYKDEVNGTEEVYFVAPKDGIGNKRRFINASGEMIERYLGVRKIRILKYARIAEGIDQERLVTSIMQGGSMQDYIIDDIFDKASGGGYIAENYKDDIYANAVYTDLKGYITTAINYTALYIDNEYAREYIQNNPIKVSKNNTKEKIEDDNLNNNE